MLLLPSQLLPPLHKFSLNFQPCRAITQTKFNFKFSCTASYNSFSTFDFNAIIDYGPSLSKGQKLIELEEVPDSNYLVKQSFSRVFDIAALRVPAEECHALQARLKGHLLNWPRIRNIARVSGDDIDEHIKELFEQKEDENGVFARNENVDDPLRERVELANKFNSRGFIHFKKLAQMSRPKVKKRTGHGSQERGKGGRNKDEYATIEVVDENGETNEDEDLTGLLGDDFRVKSWKGPTRLLLLDERHARKAASELPQAVQVLLREDTNQSRKIKYEVVQCKLTLFYDYWRMDEVLEELLPKGMVVPSSYELVGHIAHLNLRTEHLPYRRLIAQVVFDKNRPKVQTVVNKIDAIQNDYRTMQLEVLAGNHSLVTTVVENGIRFQVDLATVYWNSRLGTERQRLINNFKRGDNVCDVFSGVGPLAIAAAKKVNRVYANDLNPFAVKYQLKNIACNKLQGKVEVFNKDGREFIKEILGRENPAFVTQVVMNLPNDAAEYLDAFRGVFREKHRDMHLPSPTIHVYGFSKASEPESEFLERIGRALGEAPTAVDMHRVRLVAPGKWMLCATFPLPKRVAFAS